MFPTSAFVTIVWYHRMVASAGNISWQKFVTSNGDGGHIFLTYKVVMYNMWPQNESCVTKFILVKKLCLEMKLSLHFSTVAVKLLSKAISMMTFFVE